MVERDVIVHDSVGDHGGSVGMLTGAAGGGSRWVVIYGSLEGG